MNKQALINALFSSLGAFVCIGFLAYLNSSIEGAIWLIPPFGASMVLVMAVYDSPLAKPKNLKFKYGGEGGIRTHERVAPLLVFKTSAFNRSATSPLKKSIY